MKNISLYAITLVVVVTLFQLAYSIATIVYIRELHDAPEHTHCSQVTPAVREFWRIGGWITLAMVVLMVGWLGIYLGVTGTWQLMARLYSTMSIYHVLHILLFLATIAYNLAVPILSIQYTNTLRDATTDTTHVAECIRLAPYRRETMMSTAWINIMTIVVVVGCWVPFSRLV